MRDPMNWLLGGILVFFVGRMILGAMRRISSQEAHAKVSAGALLLDVRTPSEFASGALPGAKNIPVQSLAGRLEELPRDRPIVVYCASGMRSASATSLLKSRGFDAHDLGPGSRW